MECLRVVVFAGPTGGHFYPALAFIAALKNRYPEANVLLLTGERGRSLAEKTRELTGREIDFLPDFPFPRPRKVDFVIQVIPFLLKLASAFSKTRRIFNTFRPNLTVGFGSYIAFPGLVESRRRNIPTLIHEQNCRMGWANTLTARYADQVAVSFEDTIISRVPYPHQVTGLPLRPSLLEKASLKRQTQRPILPSERIRILILGGSQGSQSLNDLWMGALSRFSREEKGKIAVMHITGKEKFEPIQKMYPAQEVEAWVAPFYERMEEIFPEADLALTRAGAGTLFELALFGIPAVVIPYPYAEGHQELNARYFADRGGVILLKQSECTGDVLYRKITELIHSSDLRENLSNKLKRLARPDASEKLIDIVEELLGERKTCTI